MRPSAWLLAVLVLAPCCGCSAGAGAQSTAAAQSAAQPADQPATSPPAPVGDTLAQLKSLAAEPACSEDSQCHSLPLGESPCGGPEGYLAYSSAGTPPDALRALGERYRAERRAANGATGRMGACRFTPDPGALCKAGRCVLGTPGFLVH